MKVPGPLLAVFLSACSGLPYPFEVKYFDLFLEAW